MPAYNRHNVLQTPNNIGKLPDYDAIDEQLRRLNGAGLTSQPIMHKALFVVDNKQPMTPDRDLLIRQILEVADQHS